MVTRWVRPPPAVPTCRRPAGLAIPVAGRGPVPIGDAALARDALASQGLSIGLSDACLARGAGNHGVRDGRPVGRWGRPPPAAPTADGRGLPIRRRSGLGGVCDLARRGWAALPCRRLAQSSLRIPPSALPPRRRRNTLLSSEPVRFSFMPWTPVYCRARLPKRPGPFVHMRCSMPRTVVIGELCVSAFAEGCSIAILKVCGRRKESTWTRRPHPDHRGVVTVGTGGGVPVLDHPHHDRVGGRRRGGGAVRDAGRARPDLDARRPVLRGRSLPDGRLGPAAGATPPLARHPARYSSSS